MKKDLINSGSAMWNITGMDAGEDTPVVIQMFGSIAFQNSNSGEINSAEIVAAINAVPKGRKIQLVMNSTGGSFSDGLAIATALRDRENTECVISGICASAATLAAFACKKVSAIEGSVLMIHYASGSIERAHAEEMRSLSEQIAACDKVMLDTYEARSGLDRNVLADLMRKEERITAEKALELNLIDEILPLVRKRGISSELNIKEKKAMNNEPEVKAEAKAEAQNVVASASVEAQVNAEKTAEIEAKLSAAKTKAAAMEARMKAAEEITARLQKEKIEACVEAAIRQRKISNTEKDKWIEACVKAPDTMNLLNGLPEMNYKPVEGYNSEPILANAGNDSIGDIAKRCQQLEGIAKSRYITANAATIRGAWIEESPHALSQSGKVSASITVPTELKQDYIQERMLWAFSRKNGRVDKVCTTRFDATGMQLGTNKIDFQVMPVSSESVQTFSSAYTTTGSAATSKVTVEIDKRKYVPLSYTSADVATQPLLQIEGHLLRNAEKLADAIWDDVMALILPATFTNVPAAMKVGTNVFDITHIAKLQAYLDSKNWPSDRRNLVLNSDYNLALTVNRPELLLKTDVITSGKILNPWGFNYYESNPHIPNNSVHLYGFACTDDAILFASAPIIPTEKARNTINWRLVTPEDGGMSLIFRDWFDPDNDKYVEIVEARYGIAAGDTNALVPLVSQ